MAIRALLMALQPGIQGWKLPNMMFATRRSLSDACSSISRQLESVYTSIAVSFFPSSELPSGLQFLA